MKYQFVNNWQQDIILSDSAESADLDLPDGRYRLVVRDDERTRFEVVDALVAGGSATLARGQEDSESQDWPAGSVIYCALTAGQITNLSGLAGEGSPQGVVVAPQNTTYIDELDGTLWVCVWSDGESSDWLPQAMRDIVSPVGSLLSLGIPVDGEWLLMPGAAVEFTFVDAIYANTPLSGAPRRIDSAGVTHIRGRQVDGGGMLLVATPLTEYPGPI